MSKPKRTALLSILTAAYIVNEDNNMYIDIFFIMIFCALIAIQCYEMYWDFVVIRSVATNDIFNIAFYIVVIIAIVLI